MGWHYLEVESLEKYNVESDRNLRFSRLLIPKTVKFFAGKLAEIDVLTPRSIACVNMQEAYEAVKTVGYPIIIRAAYTLGGLGSGFCANDEELEALAIQSIHLFATDFGRRIDQRMEGSGIRGGS